MASLREAVKNNQEELRDGIAWVVFWREGRSWTRPAFPRYRLLTPRLLS